VQFLPHPDQVAVFEVRAADREARANATVVVVEGDGDTDKEDEEDEESSHGKKFPINNFLSKVADQSAYAKILPCCGR
jgi:hypothetical protein